MAQYYSSLFQSGLARESTLPPTAGPSKSASHQASSSATTAATVRDASMRFVFGDNGSLRAHAKSSSADQPRSGGHASFLSMNSSEKRSMVTSATSSAQRPQITAPSRPVQSPPSPALSTHSTQSHLMRSPPSPIPPAPLKASSSIRRANVTSEMPSEASTMRSLSSASSIYRRTNRSRALAALEGRPEMKRDPLKAVPESRSFVPFDDSDDEGQSENGGFKRFVERTRAAAVREKEERERARHEAEARERAERSARPASVAAAKPSTPAQRSAPGTTPAYSYNQNFIDLDDDGSNSSGRSRSTRSHSMAGLSLSSGGSSSKNPANGPVAGSSRAAQRPEWHSSVMHIASAA